MATNQEYEWKDGQFVALEQRNRPRGKWFDRLQAWWRELPLPMRFLLVLALVYVLSPLDIAPDFIPVIGWLDDIAVLGGAAAVLLSRIGRKPQAPPQ